MRPIAKRLVAGSAAAAERHPVPDLVLRSVRRFDRQTAFHPNRPADVRFRVLDEVDRGFKLGLNRLSGFLIPSDQSARRTSAGFFNGDLSGSRITGFLREGPSISGPMAKTGDRA